jgi:hypothetical protein
LDLEVAVALGEEVVQPLQADQFGLGEGGRLVFGWSVEGDEPKRGGVDMHADHVIAVDATQRG